MFDISYLFFCFLGQNPEPVSNHAQDRSEIRQTHQNPEPDQRLIPFHVFYFSITTYKKKLYGFNTLYLTYKQNQKAKKQSQKVQNQ